MTTKLDFFRDWPQGTTTAIRQPWESQLELDVFFWCSTCSSSQGFTTSVTGTVGDTQLLLAHHHQLLLKAFPCRTDPSSLRPRLARPLRHQLLTSLKCMSHPPPTQRLPRVHPSLSPLHPQDSLPLRALMPPARHQCLLSDPHLPALGVQ